MSVTEIKERHASHHIPKSIDKLISKSVSETKDTSTSQNVAESQQNHAYINPTPVFWSPTYTSKRSSKIEKVIDVPKNLTGQFFDMLRTVVTSAEIARKKLSHAAADYKEIPSTHHQYPFHPHRVPYHPQQTYPVQPQHHIEYHEGRHLFR